MSGFTDQRSFWVALYSDGKEPSCDWFNGGVGEASRRWPDASSYIDCTDMSDDDFQAFITPHLRRAA